MAALWGGPALAINSCVRARADEVLACGIGSRGTHMQLELPPSVCTCEHGDGFRGSEAGRLGSCCGSSGAAVFDGAGLV